MVKKSLKPKPSKNRDSAQDIISSFGLFVIAFTSFYIAATAIVSSNLYPDYYKDLVTFFYALQTPLLLITGFALGYFLLGKKGQDKRFVGVVMAFLTTVFLQTTDMLRFSLGFFSSPTTVSFITPFYSERATFLFLLFTVILVSLITFIFRRTNVKAFSRRQMSVISTIIVFPFLLYPLNYIISGFLGMDFATKPLELLAFSLLNPLSIVALVYLLLNRFDKTERIFYAALVSAMYSTLSFTPSFEGVALSLLSILGFLLYIALVLLVFKLRRAVITN